MLPLSMKNEKLSGHAYALFCVVLWGTTFVSTKILLEVWNPLTILILRFVLGALCLFLLSPRLLPRIPWKEERYFAGAGLSGVTLYYLVENQALVFTTASNVGIFVCTSPFFVILLEKLLNPGRRLSRAFLLGCLISFAGVALICWNGSDSFDALAWSGKEMLGNLMAIGAGLVWAFYVACTRKLGTLATYPVIPMTRRIFLWGLIFTLPFAAVSGVDLGRVERIDGVVLANLFFLSVGASALCFVLWNKAVESLGALVTSTYVYLIPAITVVTAAIFLEEPVTLQLVAGLLLILAGLFLANGKGRSEAANKA